MREKCTLLFVLFFVISLPAYSQSRTLTLQQAKSLALENNLNVQQAQNNIESAQGSVLAAYGGYLPSVGISGAWTRTQTDRAGVTDQLVGGVVISTPGAFTVSNYFSSRADISYTIFNGLSREANLSRATANENAAEFTAVRSRQFAVYQVEAGYLNILRNQQLVRVSEENLKRGRRQLERITESNRVGALSLADVYRQQSQVAADELNLIQAQNNLGKSIADLVSLIGLDVTLDYKFEDPTISTEVNDVELGESAKVIAGINDLSQRALAARPDYLASHESLNASKSGVTMARSGYFPSISASAGYSLGSAEFNRMKDNKNLSWGVNLRWTIFDGFQTNQSLQSAIVSKRNAELGLEQSQRNINVEVKKALLDLDAAGKQYEVSVKGLVSATQDRRIAEERYNLGAGTLLDLLIANAGFVSAEANRVNASYNFIITRRYVEFVIGEKTY